MRVRRLTIQDFRGVAPGVVDFAGNTLLVGGNNAGESTVCEALDLVLGPERLSRRPVVNERDFHKSRYLGEDGAPVEIRLEATLLEFFRGGGAAISQSFAAMERRQRILCR